MSIKEKQLSTPYVPGEKELIDIVEGNQEIRDIQERHPDWPQLDVEFYFAPHGNYKDMEGIIPHIRESDIFLYENMGRDEGYLTFFNKVANNPSMDIEEIIDMNTISEGVPMKGSHREPAVRGLYKSSTAVGTIDIGKTDDENKLADNLMDALEESIPRGLEYFDVLSLQRDRYARIAELQDQREKIMVVNFDEEIDKILQSRPDLKEKKDLKVLISMGAYHTRLRHAFTENGIDSDHQFSTGSSFVYNYPTEVMRSFAYDKEPSDELLMRALTERIIRTAIPDVLLDKNISEDDETVYFRRLVSQLNPDEMELIFFEWDGAAGKVTAEQLNELMIDFGHPELPKSAAEILEANKKFDQRKHRLGKTAVKV